MPVKAKIVAANGTVGPGIDIRDHPDDPRQADVAVLDEDRFVVAYIEDDPSGERPEFRIVDRDGNVLVTENVVSPSVDSRGPQLAVLPEDRFVVAWTDDTNLTNGSIYLRIYDDQGNGLSGLVTVAESSVADERGPAITPLADGKLIGGNATVV